MKKGIIKGVIVLSVFLMALITISNIMNQGNTDMTIEMAEAVYPVVSVDYNGYSLNQMHGYAQAMPNPFSEAPNEKSLSPWG